MKRGQALVQPHVAWGLRQNAQQRHHRLVGQIVRKKQVSIGDRGAHCDCDVVGIRLIDDGRGRFQLLHDNRPFFGGDRDGWRGSLHAPQHLLIILHVQRVLGLGGGQHLVQVASAGQVSVLDRGVSQKLGDLVDVRALAGFAQQQQQRVQCARIVAHMGDHGVQAGQQFGRVGRQQSISVPGVNFERLMILTEPGAALCQQKQPLGVIVHGEQLLGDRASVGRVSDLQVRLQQVAQTFGMRVEVRSLLQVGDGVLGIVTFEGGLSAQQQYVTVARIERQHPFQNVFGGGEGTTSAQRFSRRAENLPRLFLFSEPDIDLGELDPHGHIFRVHFEDLLEQAYRLVEVAILHEVFGDLQILGAGVVEQPLLGVEFRQFQRSIHARMELGDLLVHGDALDGEALRSIGITHRFEALDGFGDIAETRVKIANGVVDGKVLGIVLQDLVILSNGVL